MKPQSSFPLIRWYEIMDSTNSEAARKLNALDNLSVVATVCQTAGRGRGSHKWVSTPGESLTFSLVLKFGNGAQAPLPAQEAVRITHYFTVAMCEYLESEGVKPRIKWPNDIWVGDRKICGVLMENGFGGGYVTHSIIGIGLNLGQSEFDPALPNPVSLHLLTGKDYSIGEVLDSLYKIFCRLAARLDSEDGRARLELEFSKRMFVLEKPVADRIQASIDNFESGR